MTRINLTDGQVEEILEALKEGAKSPDIISELESLIQ